MRVEEVEVEEEEEEEDEKGRSSKKERGARSTIIKKGAVG